jgi:hypothetical protein
MIELLRHASHPKQKPNRKTCKNNQGAAWLAANMAALIVIAVIIR